MSLAEAAYSAAKVRLRPILMSVLSMVFGLVPLMLTHGVGANGSRLLVTGVIGGMIVGTLVLLFLVPLLPSGGTTRRETYSYFYIKKSVAKALN